jgi:hypothetical protein
VTCITLVFLLYAGPVGCRTVFTEDSSLTTSRFVMGDDGQEGAPRYCEEIQLRESEIQTFPLRIHRLVRVGSRVEVVSDPEAEDEVDGGSGKEGEGGEDGAEGGSWWRPSCRRTRARPRGIEAAEYSVRERLPMQWCRSSVDAAAADDDDDKPVWPNWDVGALFRGTRCIHINGVSSVGVAW